MQIQIVSILRPLTPFAWPLTKMRPQDLAKPGAIAEEQCNITAQQRLTSFVYPPFGFVIYEFFGNLDYIH